MWYGAGIEPLPALQRFPDPINIELRELTSVV